MKKKIFTAFVVLALILSSCKKNQYITDKVTFEELTTGPSGYWNGSDNSGGFTSGNIFFANNFDPVYNSWSGFAYSRVTDTITKDYTNQYSCVAKGGAEGSEKYGVYFSSGKPDTIFFTIPERVTEISLCNTVYTYHTIKNGNQFSKKFGGVTGNDEDWFKLTITAIDPKGKVVGSGYLYLAYYNFPDNPEDYITQVWDKIDLSVFGYVKALAFELTSTDTGPYGMNTPAYFCIDNIKGILYSE
jgi:hypothetical protein